MLVALGRDIVQVFEAIPDRIEVSGREPTWQVTGGSFEAAVTYAREAFGDPVVVARQDRRRWWPRVTLTVTKDPLLAASAPPFEVLANPEPEPEPEPEAVVAPEPVLAPPSAREPTEPTEPEAVVAPPEPATEAGPLASLEEMFAYQEELRASAGAARVPPQRRRR